MTQTRQTTQKYPTGEAGFSLTEMIVVLVMLALVATLSLPLLKPDKPGLVLRKQALEIASLLRTTRATAIGRNKEVVFSLDLKNRLYWAEGVSRKKTLGAENRPETEQQTDIIFQTARSEVQTAHLAQIRFFADGSATGGTITLKQRTQQGEFQEQIAIDWLTGQVSLEAEDKARHARK